MSMPSSAQPDARTSRKVAYLESPENAWFTAVSAASLIPDCLGDSETVDLGSDEEFTQDMDERHKYQLRFLERARGPATALNGWFDCQSFYPTLWRTPNWIATVSEGIVVQAEVVALPDSVFGLIVRSCPGERPGQVTVQLPGELILLGQEWDRETGQIDCTAEAKGETDAKAVHEEKEAAIQAAKQRYAERLQGMVPYACWLPPELLPADIATRAGQWHNEPAKFAERIESLIPPPLAMDGCYNVLLLRAGDADGYGLLVTYFPRPQVSPTEQLIEWTRAYIPEAFRFPLSTKPCPPDSYETGIPVPTDLPGVMAAGDLGIDNESTEEAERRIRESFQEHGAEALGWYQSCHSWDDERWGIYLHAARINDLGRSLRSRLAAAGCTTPDDAFEIARRLIWEHEFFHAKLDFLALGQEAAARRALALPYSEHVYSTTKGTSA
ncbi:MAG: hypothetical protein GXY83_44040, partial [Rhodopirellula sp.]|nr:hypothetical protein [Rhodopirellula sp.]